MAHDEPLNGQVNDQKPLERLERQVERGGFFTHTALSNNARRLYEMESFLYGLIDVLIEKKIATSDEVLQATAKVRQEMEKRGENLGPGIALRVDEDETGEDEFVAVNCAERLHICKAICCSLSFALSAEEVESGKIKWDLGQPYYIRQEKSGCCTHLDPEEKDCQIYQDRPSVCRKYSCAGDDRIWKDFEKMKLNEDWIKEHIGDRRPRLVRSHQSLTME